MFHVNLTTTHFMHHKIEAQRSEVTFLGGRVTDKFF